MAHVENLKPWKPGQSGNPGGRPKKKWLTEVFEEMLEEKLSDPVSRAAFKETIWSRLLSQQVAGAMTLNLIWERTEGKLTKPVEVNGEIDIVSLIEEGRKRLGE